jgi:hypothetical protein
MKLQRIAIGITALLGIAWMATPVAGSATTVNSAIPHYRHIVEIMMENQSYSTIIGNPNAPQINALANTYGLATNYFGVTHPSEPNYMANIAGDYFGVQDDNQFYCTPAMASTDPNCGGTTVNHTINAPTLADQLSTAGMTWKGYFQGLPPKYPSNSIALYASKHNPFLNFTGTQGALANMVPDTQLATDLAGNTLPNFSLVVPDQCHDMHGTGTCGNHNSLISAGDQYVGQTVNAIMTSKTWTEGRNAIVITWDENDFSDAGSPGTGCCGSSVGGGHVVTIVITNKGSYLTNDGTADNHYSLLRSFEAAFGLATLGHAGDASVHPMTALFHNS